MTNEEFEKIETTEEERLIASACKSFGINPLKLHKSFVNSLLKSYKALLDYNKDFYKKAMENYEKQKIASGNELEKLKEEK